MIDWCEYYDKPIEAMTEEEKEECPVPGYGLNCSRCECMFTILTETEEGET